MKIYACDFETTVYEGQERTDVWSSAICPVRTKNQMSGAKKKPQATADDVIIHHSIDETFAWLENQKESRIVLYYHNLKFDGSFWLDFLMHHGWSYYKRIEKRDVPPAFSFETCISDMGQWYYIRLFFPDDKIVEMRDSMKIMPMSLRTLGKSFNTKDQKLDMEYTGRRYPGCPIYSAERQYIKNDVLVLMECLEVMIYEGHTKLTIGSCCMDEYKKSLPAGAYAEMFPDLVKIKTPDYITESNADEFLRKSYKGGWCYAKPDRCGKITAPGCTADVNSLYPSVMSSESGSRYPVGVPHWFIGKPPKDILKSTTNHYYFIKFRCAFSLKPDHLPFVQIKGNPFYVGTEMLTDSRPRIHGKKYREFTDAITGQKVTDEVELTMTCKDFELFQKHYFIYNLKFLYGCWFYTDIGIFDNYIDKWRDIKMHSKNARRKIAKMFLNNLYGKMAASTNSSYKRPVLDSDGVVKMQTVIENNKKAGFIAVGSAVTSYARCFTITAAQKNYKYFCYADTDSIHCTCRPDQLEGVPVDPVKFCHWKIESSWDYGYFLRQKTYLEHVVEEDQQPCQPYYNLKCAGLPDACKDLMIDGMTESEDEQKHAAQMQKVCEIIKDNPLSGMREKDYLRYEFLSKKKKITDLKSGFRIPGKLRPVRIPGGILLEESFFTVR